MGRNLSAFGALLFAAFAAESAVPPRPLPGEDGMKPAISPAPFPDRMSAYVWRNWGLVGKERLAEVVGATAEDLAAVAAQMGLEPDPAVLPEWRRRGYITVIRRNWHLLPYDQLLKLLDMTRDELHFALMEDDFLWVKLGRIKPKCEALLWSEGMREEGKVKRERIAAILKEEGLDPNAPEEPRFTFVKDIAAADPGFRLPGKDESPFGFRLIFSYFADYGDPLGDPEIGSYPEGLLQKLAAQGVNAVWLHTVLRTLAKDPKYPEFGEGCEKRLANLRKLVARCRKYGIGVFLYMNEPRAMPASFFGKDAARQAMKGACEGGRQAMCTSCPETLRWLRDSLEQVFSRVPGLGGIFTITMSENLTNCASRRTKATCPRCRDRRDGDIIAEVNRAMIDGMTRGNPKTEALVWNWAWPKDEEADIVSRLPKGNVRLMAVSENAMPIRRGGVRTVEADYSISVVGPGENAKRFWGLARERGIPAVAKVQAANSWELSSFPYVPAMDLVAEHAGNIANEGVDGVMLSWSLGCCPSPNLGIYRELRRGERDREGVLDRMAVRLYGAANVARVRRAWTAFSEGFANFPFSCSTLYYGLQQWGPANPLYARKTGWRASMVGIPYDALDSWRAEFPAETYVELIGRVADGFAEGCRLMEGVAERRELDMFRAEQMHFASCRDQALFVMARDAGDEAGMRKYARAELERAKAYWPLVRADSRIGYESSNQYFFVPRDVLEKVLSCAAVLAATPEPELPMETAELQRRIDEAAAAGGGRVTIGPGVHKSGTIYLKSGVNLHLEKGAVLLASDDLGDYNALDAFPQNAGVFAREGWQAKHLIVCLEQENVSITGAGTIDGNGRAFFEDGVLYTTGPVSWRNGGINSKDFRNSARPGQLVEFCESRNVRVEGVTFVDPPAWTLFFHGCENVTATDLRITCDMRHMNTDGIDIDACRHVRVSRCDIRTGDDAIAIRGAPARLRDRTRACEDIVVEDVVARVSASGCRIGVGDGVIRNVRLSNVRIESAGVGLRVHSAYLRVGGAEISDITLSRVSLLDTAVAVIIEGSNGKRPHDIRFEDVLIERTDYVPGEMVRVENADNVSLDGIRYLDAR